MIVALDLETTWVDSKKDKIIEVALVKFDEKTFEIIDTFSTLINPWIIIPEVISNITNIFDYDLINAPIFENEIIEKISNFIWENPILWHNTKFDRDFLINNWINLEKNIVLDTFLLSNIIFLYEKSLNLWNLCESLDIKLVDAHRALDDTLWTIKLFEKITNNFKILDENKKNLLNYIFSKSNDKSFEYYKKLFLFESNVINFDDFIKNTLEIIWKYDNLEVNLENGIQESLKSYNVNETFKNLPNSELRQNQLIMSWYIDDMLNNDKKIVIEAPTWVGKTFAYLIPSILYSLKNKEQVIISTNTKALQDQIFYKDLEFLEKNIWYDFSYSKLKWRKNYFSISRYFEYLTLNEILDLDETIFFWKICLWLFDTKYWELDELNFYPKENYLSRQINSDHFLVLFENNDYKYYEHIFKARTKANKSDIVIINHSLLIQDASSTQPIFGQIKNLIIDEAHNLEDTITDALIKSFSLSSVKDSIDKILNILKKSNFYIDNIDVKLENFYSQVTLLFDIFLDYSIKQNNFWNENYEALIDKDFYSDNQNIKNFSNNIEIILIEIFNHLQTSPDKVFSSIKTDISNLEEILSIIKICLDEKSIKTYIPIFSYNKYWNNNLYYTVLNPWNFLKSILWDKINSITLTSATLKINDNFEYIKNILKLEEFNLHSLESDFDYSKQSLLYIPTDLWSIKYNNPRINDFVLNFLKIVKWNTLILLTSFNSIKDMFLNLNLPLKKLWTTVLAQWVWWSKHKIANHFKKNAWKSIILWTDSFWEWVDLPWDDLKYLFIHKFPFLVPTDPIFKARWKLYKDAFLEYSIPKAIIKTKQWFWRLIRTKKDSWIVILLDDRYFSTNWWIHLRASFPNKINIKMCKSNNFIELIKNKFLD